MYIQFFLGWYSREHQKRHLWEPTFSKVLTGCITQVCSLVVKYQKFNQVANSNESCLEAHAGFFMEFLILMDSVVLCQDFRIYRSFVPTRLEHFNVPKRSIQMCPQIYQKSMLCLNISTYGFCHSRQAIKLFVHLINVKITCHITQQ